MFIGASVAACGKWMLAAQNCTKANWVTLNEELGVRLSLCGKCPQGGAGTVRGTGGNVLHPTEVGWLLMGMWQVCEAGGVGFQSLCSFPLPRPPAKSQCTGCWGQRTQARATGPVVEWSLLGTDPDSDS